jgi:hypothetical protein
MSYGRAEYRVHPIDPIALITPINRLKAIIPLQEAVISLKNSIKLLKSDHTYLHNNQK